MKSLDLVIFDMDGTLYPNHEGFNAVYPRVVLKLAAAKRNTSLEETEVVFRQQMAELEEKIGGRPTWTLTLLAFYDISFAEFEQAIDRELMVETLLIPDPRSVQAVERVAERFPIALYTTNNGLATERILNHLGFQHIFPADRRFTLSSVGELKLPRPAQLAHVKPGERGFRYVLQTFNANPERTMMIGDSMVSDIEPACRLGLQTHHVTCPEDLYLVPEVLGC